MIASATRLRLRASRFLPPFLWQVWRVRRQTLRAAGNRGIELRKTAGLAFWTKTLWQSRENLVGFHTAGAHEAGKPRLATWCDEAVHAHWEREADRMPSWAETEAALVEHGRLSALDYPSAAHAAGRINTD